MHDLDSGSSCGDSTVDPEDDLVIERVRYPEPTEDDIRKSRLITEEYLSKHPMPKGTFTNESNMNGLTRATGYRIDQTIIATSGKKIKRRKKRGRQDTDQPRSAKWVKAIHSVKHEEDEFVWKSDYSDSDEEKTGGKTSTLYEDQLAYLTLCKKLHLAPCGAFLRGLVDDAITVRYHSLTAEDIKACCIVLLESINVYRLDFRGNEFGVAGASYVADLLNKNTYITYLDVSECCLLSKGADVLVREVMEVDRLTYLNMSGNQLQEDDAMVLSDYIKQTASLKELHLSQNVFTEKGAMILAAAIAIGDTLEVLNLSWNHIRRQGAIAVSNALKSNIVLREINLSWNGFHEEGCRAMGDMLVINSSLESIDITGNRVDKTCLDHLMKGCAQNKTLNTLKLANNPITSDGAVTILTMLQQNPECVLRDIDISGQSVDTTFLQKLSDLQSGHVLRVLHGPVLYENQRKGPGGILDTFPNDPPLTVILEFLRIKGVSVAELFAIVEKPAGKKQFLSRDELKICVQSVSLPVSERSLDKIVNRVQMENNIIEYPKFAAAERAHKKSLVKMRQTAAAEPFEQTTIGMIHAKLNTLMYMNQKNMD